MVNYHPTALRMPDSQYRDMLERVLREGVRADQTRQGVGALTVIRHAMDFDLRNGFPVITERDISSFWTRGIGELCAFMNGVTNVKELGRWGANWWMAWGTTDKTGPLGLPDYELGPASYGGVLTAFPTLDGGRFNQVTNLVRQIKELPYDRVHKITTWMPAENARGVGLTQRNTIAPCHGNVQVTILNDQLYLHMEQRSGDLPVGVPSNMIQYAALALMLEHLTGYQAVQYSHTVVNAHIYDNQIADVEEMLGRDPLPFPTVRLTDAGQEVTDIAGFRREHFVMDEYQAHPAMPGIPVST